MLEGLSQNSGLNLDFTQSERWRSEPSLLKHSRIGT